MTDLSNEVITELLETVRDTKDFAVEHAPDVVQQMVMYYVIIGWSATLSFLLLTAVVVKFAHCAEKKLKLHNEKKSASGLWIDPSLPFAPWVFAIIVVLFTSLGITHYASIAIKATFAPKWFIVEKLMELI